MAVSSGGAETARLRAEEALALDRRLGDTWGTAYTGIVLGNAVVDEGDLTRAQELFEESVRPMSAPRLCHSVDWGSSPSTRAG